MGDGKVADPVVDTIMMGVPTTLTTTSTTITTKSESSDVNETNIPRGVDCDSTGTVH